MKRFILFLLVGGTNTLIGITIMIAFYHLTGNPYIANIVAYMIGFLLSFYLQDIITFGDIENKSRSRIIGYSATYATAFLVNFIFLSGLLCISALPKEVIFVLSSGVFAITSYILMKNFVFIEHCTCNPKNNVATPPC